MGRVAKSVSAGHVSLQRCYWLRAMDGILQRGGAGAAADAVGMGGGTTEGPQVRAHRAPSFRVRMSSCCVRVPRLDLLANHN
ncbi:unnamed protein product [Boreogadus saida]